jgi:non-canonical (house-cleaning) NTP pyrophosphatase
VLVAVGSTRAPKVEAVRRVLAALAPLVVRLRGASVTALDLGDVGPAMPLTLQELLDGSRLRALRVRERLRAQGETPDLAVGLEGGLDVRSRHGTWGMLTRGLVDRTRSFEMALLNALAPFYNAERYA